MAVIRTFLLLLSVLALQAQDPFGAAAAQALRARAGLGHFRVLLLGDSHTAARAFQAAWRSHLQAQFGDGGWGYGLPWGSATAPRCGRSPGWVLHQPTLRNGSDGRSGPGGAYLEANRAGEQAWVESPFRRLRVHLLRQPGGGRVRLRVDGREAATADLDGPLEALCLAPELPREGRRLEILCEGGAVRILGVALENGPGAALGALGTIGAQASWLLRSEAPVFDAVLRREAPDLVVLAFGTNEASLGDFDPAAYRAKLQALLQRVRAALPKAALLLLAPPDCHLPKGRPGALATVTRIQEEEAKRSNGLCVSLRQAMGGEGTMQAWSQTGLGLRDRVHFSAEGYLRLARAALGQLFAQMERARPALEGGEDPRIARTLAGAFELPSQAPRLLGRFEIAPVESAPAPRPIYTFRTEDGRLFITDDPEKVEGLRGAWVGRGPQ